MKWDVLRLDVLPRPPPRSRALAIAVLIGIVTGLVSSLPSPLPDIRLQNPDVLINAAGVPLHAGIAFGAGVAAMSWLWARRDPGKCLLALALTLMGWLAAVNTANDAMQAVVGSALLGTVEGAKASREVVGWILGGLSGGAVGAGLTAFGAGVPGEAIRRPQAWGLIVVTGTLFGLLLYPAALADLVAILFVPWQAAVAAAIAHGLSRPRQGVAHHLH